MPEAPVITVDGPGGTGKGTLCAYLAGWLGWHLLDSGALYRVLALAALDYGMDMADESALAGLARDLDVDFRQDEEAGTIRVILDGGDVSGRIRTEECGSAASRIAGFPRVRAALVERQHAFRRLPGLIADGRDMGTVIFPDAGLKLFLTASPEERARRRYKQLIEQGISVNLHRLSADIAERDERDSRREASPMKPAPEAIVIDTTDRDVAGVIETVTGLVRERFPDRQK
ncbi:MAG: (d)CMP kinase [Gammaproteobacteria bacterium]